jgi:anthranilate synthase component 1
MFIEPEYDSFARVYEDGGNQVVWTKVVSDLETPVSAMLKIARDEANSFLLESVEGGAVRGRYSIIGLRPDLIWRVNGGAAEINRQALVDAESGFVACPEEPLTSLRSLLAESRIALPENLPPMAAGVFGYMGYDMVRLMEHLPADKPDAIGVPDAILVRPTVMAIFDAVRDEVTLVTPVFPGTGLSAKAAHTRACDRIEDVVAALDQPLPHDARGDLADSEPQDTVSNVSADEYMAIVRQA